MSRAIAQIGFTVAWVACALYLLAVYNRGEIDEATCFKIGGALLAVLLAVLIPQAVADRQAMGRRERGFEVRHEE